MTRDPACCFFDDDVAEAVRIMERRQVRRLPVMADSDLVGMVSLGDISSRLGDQVSAEVLRAVSAHH